MPLHSALPRLLLIAMLLIASIGSAFDGAHTATRMMPAHAMQMADAGSTVINDEPACHDVADSGDASKADPRDADTSSPHPPAAPDCCQIGHCDGFCLQALPAMATLARWSQPMPAMRLMLPADQPMRPAPALAREQRPPIA